MVASMLSSSRSGSLISRLKNSITPKTSLPRRMGKPKAACSPSRWAMAARGKFSSGTTSEMYSGSTLDHTRPGSPKPGTKVNSRLTLSNSGIFYRRLMPKLDTAQHRGLPVHAPERAHVPSQTFAHGAQYSQSDLFDRGRFRQDLRDRVLHAEAFLCTLALGDVRQNLVPIQDVALIVPQRRGASKKP